jgi:hypothetical protein
MTVMWVIAFLAGLVALGMMTWAMLGARRAARAWERAAAEWEHAAELWRRLSQ